MGGARGGGSPALVEGLAKVLEGLKRHAGERGELGLDGAEGNCHTGLVSAEEWLEEWGAVLGEESLELGLQAFVLAPVFPAEGFAGEANEEAEGRIASGLGEGRVVLGDVEDKRGLARDRVQAKVKVTNIGLVEEGDADVTRQLFHEEHSGG